jgi:hypothetical protein
VLLSAQYDYYKRDQDTGVEFITPVSTFTYGAGLKLNWNQDGYNIAALGGYYSRDKWQEWGDPLTSGYDPKQKDYWKYSVDVSKGFYFADFRKLLVKVSYLDGRDLDRFSQWDFGPFSTNSIIGFPSGAVLADRAYEANVSYGLNIQEIVRFELEYTQAVVTNRQAGWDNTYFSGFGITTAFNGPWDGTRIRAEVGYPVVGQGVKGFTINAQILKLF